MVESVFDLKERYKEKGSDMIVACGKPETIVTSVVKALLKQGDRVEGVWMQKEVSQFSRLLTRLVSEAALFVGCNGGSTCDENTTLKVGRPWCPAPSCRLTMHD